MLRRWSRLLVVGAALILDAGCRSASDAGGRQSLPPAPPGTTKFSDDQPKNPYEPWGEGVLQRWAFTAPSDEGYTAVVRDFLVSPRKPKTLVRIGGAAVLEVRQGWGKATVGEGAACEGTACEKKVELSPGATFTVDAGKALHITANGGPLALRAWIIPAGEEP